MEENLNETVYDTGVRGLRNRNRSGPDRKVRENKKDDVDNVPLILSVTSLTSTKHKDYISSHRVGIGTRRRTFVLTELSRVSESCPGDYPQEREGSKSYFHRCFLPQFLEVQ